MVAFQEWSPDSTLLDNRYFFEGGQLLADPSRMLPFLVDCFAARHSRLISDIATALAGHIVTVDFLCRIDVGPLGLVWESDDAGRTRLSFPNGPVGPATVALIDRWMPLLRYIRGARNSFVGQLIVNLDDTGRDGTLCFCANHEDPMLIPDSIFLSSKAYQHEKDFFKDDEIEWGRKSEILFWRGSTTGLRDGHVLALPRLKLCQLAQEPDLKMDCRISNIVQVSDEERLLVESLDVMAPYSPWQDLSRYKYHIDIDGNSNSWPGLYLKLLSGGLVFKVLSPYGYRQWYYDDLEDGVNIVFIKADLSDLVERLTFFRENDTIAGEIAHRGVMLARQMNLDTEICRTTPAVIRAAATYAGELLSWPQWIEEVGCRTTDMHSLLTANALSRALQSDGHIDHLLIEASGQSGQMFRLFLRNLTTSLPHAKYLEVVSNPGPTLLAVVSQSSVVGCCIHDECSQATTVAIQSALEARGGSAHLMTKDAKIKDIDKLGKFNVFYYDGELSRDEMSRSLTSLFDHVADNFIFVCDDANWEPVRRCAEDMLSKLGYLIKYSLRILTSTDGTHAKIINEGSQWHNGCAVYCVHRMR